MPPEKNRFWGVLSGFENGRQDADGGGKHYAETDRQVFHQIDAKAFQVFLCGERCNGITRRVDATTARA